MVKFYFDIKIIDFSSKDYESIFTHRPSFYERRATSDLLRRKWKEDKGYCSKFKLRNEYRKSVINFKNKVNKSMCYWSNKSQSKRNRPQTSKT